MTEKAAEATEDMEDDEVIIFQICICNSDQVIIFAR